MKLLIFTVAILFSLTNDLVAQGRIVKLGNIMTAVPIGRPVCSSREALLSWMRIALADNIRTEEEFKSARVTAFLNTRHKCVPADTERRYIVLRLECEKNCSGAQEMVLLPFLATPGNEQPIGDEVRRRDGSPLFGQEFTGTVELVNDLISKYPWGYNTETIINARLLSVTPVPIATTEIKEGSASDSLENVIKRIEQGEDVPRELILRYLRKLPATDS